MRTNVSHRPSDCEKCSFYNQIAQLLHTVNCRFATFKLYNPNSSNLYHVSDAPAVVRLPGAKVRQGSIGIDESCLGSALGRSDHNLTVTVTKFTSFICKTYV